MTEVRSFKRGATVAPTDPLAGDPWSGPEHGSGWANIAGQNGRIAQQPIKAKQGKKPAAGAAVVEPDGRIWLVEPAGAYGGYKYTFPKGKLDGAASPQATAIREVFEESGLKVEIIDLIGDFERDTSITRYYLARRVAGMPGQCDAETAAVHLVPLTQLEQWLTHKNDKPVLAALAACLARRALKGEA
jgi:ADP-ribose pyrophosphatase YjhB (NUDIX family)